MRLASRLAVTLLVPVLLLILGETVLLPGVPADLLQRLPLSFLFEGRGSHANLGVFALGIAPLCTGYWLVEVGAFLVPRWSHLRHGNPEGRAKLERAAVIVALALAAVQALGIAFSLRALGGGADPSAGEFSISIPLVVVTLVGGVCVQLAAARFISRHGLLNGLVAIFGAGLLRAIFGAAATAATHESPGELAIDALALVAAAAATWAAVRGSGAVSGEASGEGNPRGPYRDARRLVMHPWIPIPASSLQAYGFAAAVMALPATLSNFRLPFQGLADLLQEDAVFLPSLAAVTLVTMVLFARVLHRPKELTDLASRLGATDADKLRLQARDAVRAALLPSSLFFLTLILATRASRASHIGGLGVAILTPIVIDLVHALGRAAAEPDLVAVWEERRASAVPLLRAALAGDGIPSETRGAAFLDLWQIFAPYAPVQILVRPADAPRAVGTLRHLLLGEERPSTPASAEPVRLPGEPWSPSRRTAVLGGTALAAGLAVALVLAPRPAPAGPRAQLEVVRVDDSIDPFASVPDSAIPEGSGIAIYTSPVPLGPGRSAQTHLARVVPHDGETKAAMLARIQPWLATLKLPEGARLAFQEVVDYDLDTNQRTFVGLQSIVLRGAPVLTTNDVSDAAATSEDKDGETEVYVYVTLTPDAGKRFEEATRQWVGRRIAIVVDGAVDSAPVVKTTISGGHVTITMGRGDPAAMVAEAQRLVSRLR